MIWQFTNVVSVYKFHVDWERTTLSSFTGPFDSFAPASWASAPATVATMGGNANDTLQPRLMMQNQYTNLGSVESIWLSHTVRGGAVSTAAPRYYEVAVTGGSIGANTTQAFTHAPDTTVQRYMQSLAVDRWGDYAAMSLDPNGCDFWFTSEYYITTGGNWQTRVGSTGFPSCMTIGNGTLQGTVTATVGGAPISGASVSFGSHTTTTNGSGVYSFSTIPAGTYPNTSAVSPGYVTGVTSSVVVAESATTTRDFALASAPASACLVDTSTLHFQTGTLTSIDVTNQPWRHHPVERSGCGSAEHVGDRQRLRV